jgi:hypothetical protein
LYVKDIHAAKGGVYFQNLSFIPNCHMRSIYIINSEVKKSLTII